jgi:hypothetical protein
VLFNGGPVSMLVGRASVPALNFFLGTSIPTLENF